MPDYENYRKILREIAVTRPIELDNQYADVLPDVDSEESLQRILKFLHKEVAQRVQAILDFAQTEKDKDPVKLYKVMQARTEEARVWLENQKMVEAEKKNALGQKMSGVQLAAHLQAYLKANGKLLGKTACDTLKDWTKELGIDVSDFSGGCSDQYMENTCKYIARATFLSLEAEIGALKVMNQVAKDLYHQTGYSFMRNDAAKPGRIMTTNDTGISYSPELMALKNGMVNAYSSIISRAKLHYDMGKFMGNHVLNADAGQSKDGTNTVYIEGMIAHEYGHVTAKAIAYYFYQSLTDQEKATIFPGENDQLNVYGMCREYVNRKLYQEMKKRAVEILATDLFEEEQKRNGLQPAGTALDDRFIKKAKDLLKALPRAKEPRGMIEGMSGYGATSAAEGFAEVFAYLKSVKRHPGKGNVQMKAMAKALDEMLKNGIAHVAAGMVKGIRSDVNTGKEFWSCVDYAKKGYCFSGIYEVDTFKKEILDPFQLACREIFSKNPAIAKKKTEIWATVRYKIQSIFSHSINEEEAMTKLQDLMASLYTAGNANHGAGIGIEENQLKDKNDFYNECAQRKPIETPLYVIGNYLKKMKDSYKETGAEGWADTIKLPKELPNLDAELEEYRKKKQQQKIEESLPPKQSKKSAEDQEGKTVQQIQQGPAQTQVPSEASDKTIPPSSRRTKKEPKPKVSVVSKKKEKPGKMTTSPTKSYATGVLQKIQKK